MTWARVGSQPEIPSTGQRNTLKIFGTIELYRARFLYQFQTVFNAITYVAYLERIVRRYCSRKTFLIHDNATYHRDKNVWQWFIRTSKIYRGIQSSSVFSRAQRFGANLVSYTVAWYTQSIFYKSKRALFNVDFNISMYSKKTITGHGIP
jgi:hypothetical protein